MTRFSVKLKNILGLSYYRYELTSSTYNATIDTAFTITCKVTDIFGNNVNNKAVTLYHDGTSVSSQNTNSNGIATWSITPSTWGIHDFNIENTHCQVNVTGWREITQYKVTQNNTPTIQAYTDGEYVRIRFKSHTISSVGTSWTVISGTDNKMPSQYCPPYGDLTSYMIYAKTEVALWNNGKLSIRVFDGSAREVVMRGDIVYPIS